MAHGEIGGEVQFWTASDNMRALQNQEMEANRTAQADQNFFHHDDGTPYHEKQHPIFAGACLLAMVAVLGGMLRDNPVPKTHAPTEIVASYAKECGKNSTPSTYTVQGMNGQPIIVTYCK